MVGPQAAILEDKQRIDGAVTIKFEQRGNLAEFLAQVEIFVFQKPDGGEIAAVDGLVNACLGNTIEAHGRASGDRRIALLDKTAQAVFVIRLVTRKRDGHQEVALVVANKVEHQCVFLAIIQAQTSSELLNKDDCGVGASKHDDLIERGDVDAFVHDIDRENVLELAGFKSADRGIADLIGILTANCSRSISESVEFARQFFGLGVSIAEN